MKQRIVAGLAALLMAGGLIAAAPPASAGCLYGGLVASRCDGPVQADGTWQRCVTSTPISGTSPSLWGPNCKLMGPDQFPLGLAFSDPPTHIDD